MQTVFQVIKGVFFLSSIFIGLFFLRGSYVIKDQGTFMAFAKIMMPGYLVLTGIVLALLIVNLVILKNDYTEKQQIQKIMVKGRIGGIVFGVILSVIYILFG